MTGLLSMSLDDLMSEARRAIIQGKKKVEAVADKSGGTEWEMKLKSATSLDNWNPSSTKLNILAQGTYDPGIYREIIPLLWQRLQEKPRYWRIVWKSLYVLDYFIRHGSERFINEAKDKTYTIQMLQNFHYVDSEEKDRGAAIRQKAKEIVELLEDDIKIRQLRETAIKNANKFVSLSSGETGGLGSSATFDSYSAGGNSSSSAAGKFGGYEGNGNDDAFDHPTVTDATAHNESKIDYSDTKSTELNTAHRRKGKGKAKTGVVAGAQHNSNAEFVNDAFDESFEDAFERDLHLSQASPVETTITAKSAGENNTTSNNGKYVDAGYSSDHELKPSAAEKKKTAKKKRVVANKAVVNINDLGKLAPPPAASNSKANKSPTDDILSFYEDKDNATSKSNAATSKKKAINPDDFLTFDEPSSSSKTTTSSSSQPSLFYQLAARGSTNSSPPSKKPSSGDDLFSAFAAPTSSQPQHQQQPSFGRVPSHPAAQPSPSSTDSWRNNLVSLDFNKPAARPTADAFGALSQRQPSYPHPTQQHRPSQPSFGGFPTQPQPSPTPASNPQDVFFGSLSSNAEKISMPPQKPRQQQPSSHDPFADLLK